MANFQEKSRETQYDTIIIGSGFGGSVMACRLAEKGEKVCLLERGRRYGMYEFPRRVHELKKGLFFDPEDESYGLYEFLDHPKSSVLSVCASGLGGGSLIYANVLMPMPEEHFGNWPAGIDRKTLEPFYKKALEMLEGVPWQEATFPKTQAFEKAARQRINEPDLASFKEPPELLSPHLAIRLAGDFPGHQSKNRQGILQSRCTACGECDVGCNIHAKNTLDLNYLARAASPDLSKEGGKPAEIRTEALVTSIESLPEGEGYLVSYRDLSIQKSSKAAAINKRKIRKENNKYRNKEDGHSIQLRARRVVLSAGSIHSTRLLLQMKREGKLPNLSEALGRHWCGNGDLEGSVLFSKSNLDPTLGPVITRALKYKGRPYPDGFAHGMVIQDGGFPWFIEWFVAGKMPSPSSLFGAAFLGIKIFWGHLRFLFSRIGSLFGRPPAPSLNLGHEVSHLFDSNRSLRHAMLLLGMGRDRSTGRMELSDDGKPVLHWDLKESKLHYDRLRSEMRQMAHALGGTYLDNPLTFLNKIVAVHPIGGCVMADSPDKGVVDSKGEVFGHPGLFVVDASILPASTGPNPSLTIAANAERIASLWKK